MNWRKHDILVSVCVPCAVCRTTTRSAPPPPLVEGAWPDVLTVLHAAFTGWLNTMDEEAIEYDLGKVGLVKKGRVVYKVVSSYLTTVLYVSLFTYNYWAMQSISMADAPPPLEAGVEEVWEWHVVRVRLIVTAKAPSWKVEVWCESLANVLFSYRTIWTFISRISRVGLIPLLVLQLLALGAIVAEGIAPVVDVISSLNIGVRSVRSVQITSWVQDNLGMLLAHPLENRNKYTSLFTHFAC